jgi:alpha-beta hydrolase superfamily lysophospholipase
MIDYRAAKKGSKVTVAVMAGSLGAAIALIWLLRHQNVRRASAQVDGPCADAVG